MAEHMRSSLNKSSKSYGTLVFPASAPSRITDIRTAEPDSRYFTVRTSDFPDGCSFPFLSGTIPALSEDRALHPGQPIMAIFGPDHESVILARRSFKVDVVPLAAEEYESTFAQGASDSLSWGNPKEDREGLRLVSSTYKDEFHYHVSPVLISCECWIDGEKLHVEVPTQWPANVRRAVAATCQMAEDAVIVHQMSVMQRYDEDLIWPSIMAVITAKACQKAGMPCVLRSHAYSASPTVEIHRNTWCAEDGSPVDEECEAVLHLGAWELDDREAMRQCLAGLEPVYNLQSFRAEVSVRRSPTPPSTFFRGSPFSEAAASAEIHATRIASSLELPFSKWKSYARTGKRPFTDYMPSVDLDSLQALSGPIIEESDFNRKWASYATQTDDFSLLSFNRGIALAEGVSVAGFSTSFSREHSFQARLTLTEKQNLTLLTSFPQRDAYAALMKKMIELESDLGEDNEAIVLDNDAVMLDSGPDVLGRAMGHFPSQLSSACTKLRLQEKEGNPPFSIVFSADEELMPCEFEPSGAAALVLELRMDSVSFTPTVVEAWLATTKGTLNNREACLSTMREEVASALAECGAKPSEDPARPFKINITLQDDTGHAVTDTSSCVRGLVKAAFLSALGQCVSQVGNRLPVSAADIEKAYRNREGKS